MSDSSLSTTSPSNQRSTSSSKIEIIFATVSRACSRYAGRPYTFITAVSAITLWALTGPFFHFSDTWQLYVNTTTTIITFLMLFLLQYTQNRDTLVIQAKLDELILTSKSASNRLLDLETLTEKDVEELLATRYHQDPGKIGE